MGNIIDINDYRLILCYKGDIITLTLFSQQADGNICFADKLPLLSSPIEAEDYQANKITLLPSVLINRINQQFDLSNDLLRTESGFNEQIETPKGIISVYLVRFNLLNPPHKLMQAKGCLLKTLPELRGKSPSEMKLLRRAYSYLMES